MDALYNRVWRIDRHGRLTWVVAVVWLAVLVLSGPLSACKVTDVDLYVGGTSDMAHDEELTEVHVGKSFYCCISWEANDTDPASTDQFVYWLEKKEGSSWESITEEEEQSASSSWHVDYEYDDDELDYGEYTIRAVVRRDIDEDDGYNSNECTINIVKVVSVSADPVAAGIDEVVSFTAVTDPAAGSYGGFTWSTAGEDDVIADETHDNSWDSLGTKTMTASVGDSSASADVDIIDGLTVLPDEAFVAVGTTKDFTAWTVEGGVSVDVTASATFTTSNESFTGATLTASSTNTSAMQGIDWVNATYGGVTTDDNHNCNLTVFKVDITTLTTTAMDITTAPAMPNITFHADIDPGALESIATFKWYLDMTFPHDALGTLEHRVPTSETDDVEGSGDWTPDWDDLLAGGSVSVHVAASVDGSSEAKDDQDSYQIRGTNPTQSQIFGIADLREKAVCWQESTHRQFNATCYTGIEMPLPCGDHDGGYGLMMITPASEAQTWNWQTNLNAGRALLVVKYEQSEQHVSNINTPGIDPDPVPTPNPPLSLTEAQHWLNALSLYRIGTYYFGYQLVSGTQYQWIRNSGTGPDYADIIVGFMSSQPWN